MSSKKILSKDLLKSKLSDWVLSKDLVTKLGLKEEDEAKIKRELLAFEEEGVIKRDGAKKGLKFKYCGTDSKQTSSEDLNKEEKTITPEIKSDIEAYIKQKAKDTAAASKTKSLREMLQFLEKSSPDDTSGILSYTLSIKRLSDSVLIRLYSGILPISEVSLTTAKFSKFINEDFGASK